MTLRKLLLILGIGILLLTSEVGFAQETVRVLQAKKTQASVLASALKPQLQASRLAVELTCNSEQNTLTFQGNRADVDAVMGMARELDQTGGTVAANSNSSHDAVSRGAVVPASASVPVSAGQAASTNRQNDGGLQPFTAQPQRVSHVVPTSADLPAVNAGTLQSPMRNVGSVAKSTAKQPLVLQSSSSVTEPAAPAKPATGATGATVPNADQTANAANVEFRKQEMPGTKITLQHLNGNTLADQLQSIFGSRFVSADLNIYELRSLSQQESLFLDLNSNQPEVVVYGSGRKVAQFRQLLDVLENRNNGSANVQTLIVRTDCASQPEFQNQPNAQLGSQVRVVYTSKANPQKIRQAIDAYRLGEVPSSTDAHVQNVLNATARLQRVDSFAASQLTHLSDSQGVRPVAYQTTEGAGLTTLPPASDDFDATNGDYQVGYQDGTYEATVPVNPPASGTAPRLANTPDTLQASRLPQGLNQSELSQKLSQLGVNVDIQESEDMGVLIIRGPQEDVNSVLQIIDAIEQLSAEADPQIQIYRLQYVSAEAIYALLNNNSVRESVIDNRPGKVAVVSLIRPNGFLLLGWGEALERTIAFIEKMDQPEQADLDQKLFQLEFVPAQTMFQIINTYFNTENGGMGAQIRIVSDARTNSLVVHASPRDMEVVESLIKRLDINTTASVLKTKIFKLKNVLASDLYSTLQQMITNSRGSTTGNSSSRPASADFVKDDGTTVRSGLLSDVKITADTRLNIVIVSAPEDAMPLIEEMIKTLDSSDAMSIAQIKIFPIVNADCTQIVTTLKTLLPSDLTSSGVKLAIASEGEPSLIGLRFAVDTRTNSVIAVGSETDLQVVDALISRLDTEDVIERKTMVYPLRNATASTVSAAINNFLDAQRTLRESESDAAGGTNRYAQLEEEVIVIEETTRDQLIVSATPRYLDMIEQLIDRLDADIPEVMVQVLIAEVMLNNVDEFGVELGLQDSLLFNRSVASDGSLVPGLNFNSSEPLGNSSTASNYKDVGGQGLSAFNLGRSNSELGFGGLVLSASSESVSMLLRALAMQQRIEVHARPQITTRNNQQAYIMIGQRVARIEGQTVSMSVVQPIVNDVPVGIIIVVKPRVDDTNRIVIGIEAEKSKLGATADGTVVGYADNGEPIRSPAIETIQAVTEVSAYDGQTTMLGGLITRDTQKLTRKVPWLGDVPLLGNLFKYDYDYSKRTELMIILTPHIVKSIDDMNRLKRIESSRMHWCLEDVREIHGNPSGVTQYGGSPEAVYPLGSETVSTESTTDTAASATASSTERVTLPPVTATTSDAAASTSSSAPKTPINVESKSDAEAKRVPVTVTKDDATGTESVESVGESGAVVRVEVVDTPKK
ncbi:MAG: secretin N-terminal domain-containing protein [Thermoguttaceae bacterium]|nr:secretin N-terminal domain-containing protein [Thermoguttaceae bacterium]